MKYCLYQTKKEEKGKTMKTIENVVANNFWVEKNPKIINSIGSNKKVQEGGKSKSDNNAALLFCTLQYVKWTSKCRCALYPHPIFLNIRLVCRHRKKSVGNCWYKYLVAKGSKCSYSLFTQSILG